MENEALFDVPYVEDGTEEPPLPSPRPPLPVIPPLLDSGIPVPEDMQLQFINEASSAGNLDFSTFVLNTQHSTLPGTSGAANSFLDLLRAYVQHNIPDEETFNEVKVSSVSQKYFAKNSCFRIFTKEEMIDKSVC